MLHKIDIFLLIIVVYLVFLTILLVRAYIKKDKKVIENIIPGIIGLLFAIVIIRLLE